MQYFIIRILQATLKKNIYIYIYIDVTIIYSIAFLICSLFSLLLIFLYEENEN